MQRGMDGRDDRAAAGGTRQRGLSDAAEHSCGVTSASRIPSLPQLKLGLLRSPVSSLSQPHCDGSQSSSRAGRLSPQASSCVDRPSPRSSAVTTIPSCYSPRWRRGISLNGTHSDATPSAVDSSPLPSTRLSTLSSSAYSSPRGAGHSLPLSHMMGVCPEDLDSLEDKLRRMNRCRSSAPTVHWPHKPAAAFLLSPASAASSPPAIMDSLGQIMVSSVKPIKENTMGNRVAKSGSRRVSLDAKATVSLTYSKSRHFLPG